MSYQTDILTPFEKIQEAITSINKKAYINVFTFKRISHNNSYYEKDCFDEYHYSITPLKRCLSINKAHIYDKYKYQLSFDSNSDFTQCINSGGIIGIFPQRTNTLEVTMDKITIICSEIRISKEEMYFIKPRILTGQDLIDWINPDAPNGYFSLSTQQVRSFIETPLERVDWRLQLYKASGVSNIDVAIKKKELMEEEEDNIKNYYRNNVWLRPLTMNISNLLFSEPFPTNNLNKKNTTSFSERNKEKRIIHITVEFGIDKSSLSYSIEGKTFIEEASSVNYYWDEEINNIYSTNVSFDDNKKFVEYIAQLIAKYDMVIVGNEYLSVQGNYQLLMAIPDDDELDSYRKHPIREYGYQPKTLPDEIPLENRVKYISTVIGGDCVHSHKSSEIRGTRHSL